MHTPGPWTAERQPHGYHIGPQPDGVCTIHDNSDGSKRDEQAANARLIAAAPELLTTLQDILLDMAANESNGLTVKSANRWASVERARAAIAHATQEPTP